MGEAMALSMPRLGSKCTTIERPLRRLHSRRGLHPLRSSGCANSNSAQAWGMRVNRAGLGCSCSMQSKTTGSQCVCVVCADGRV